MVGSIVYWKHKQFNVFSLNLWFVEAFGGLTDPKALLHDKILMYFVSNDIITSFLVFILLVESEKFEPVD